MGHNVVSRDLQLPVFVSTGKTKIKQKSGSRSLRFHYAIFMNSLRSLRAIPRKSKLKNQMAQIEEINFDLYETVIPGIETLHFTS